MSAKDAFHEVVKRALVKAGWTITHDPFPLKFDGRKQWVDLGAQEQIGAEREGRKIAVEIKTFSGVSAMSDLQEAVGQYMIYALLLRRKEPERTLFLAVPADSRDLFFGPDAIEMRQEFGLNLFFYGPDEEVIIEWIETT